MIINLNGGLGNQLFQFALSIHLNKVFDQKIQYDISDFGYKLIHQGFALEKLLIFPQKSICSKSNLSKINPLLCSKYGRIFLRRLPFHPNILIDTNLSKIPNSPFRYYWGDWHNLNLDYAELIRPYLQNADSKPGEKDLSNSIFIHVRRGDYVNNSHHNLCSLNYYERAINYFSSQLSSPEFRVYSDDIPWCRDNLSLILKKENHIFSQADNAIYEFNEMRSCGHGIISNSTFSWWAAQLIVQERKQATIIYPNNWSNNSKYKIHIPDQWIGLARE